MAIITGGQTGVQQDTFAFFMGQITQSFKQIASGLMENFGGSNTVTANFPPKLKKEKVYVDDGFSNIPGTSFIGSQVEGLNDFKTRRITTQEPQMTVYIKKRMWSSLRNENDTKFMDPGEKLFMRASKILFENKCLQIASYESLTKLSRLVSEDAQLDADRITAIRDTLQEFSDNLTASANSAVEAGQISQLEANNATSEPLQLLNAFNDLITAQTKLNQSTTTSWVVDPQNTTDSVGVGLGVGVIELASVTSLSTSLSLEYANQGSVQFSFEDPYNLTKITSDAIEIALNAAFQESQPVTNTNGQTIGEDPQQLLAQAQQKDQQLSSMRKNRINTLFGFGGAGTLLSQSDSVEIVFEIEASSYAKNKVTGSVATISTPFTADTFRIILLQLPVQYQLTAAEDALVVEIFGLLDRYVTAIEKINNATLANNSESRVQYARRQLRLHYLGKSIVQPMDGIHVFIRGNTFKDGEITGPLGVLLNGSNFIKSFATDGNVSDAFLQEEMKQFGIDDILSVDLYRNLRTGSFMRNGGFHVFGGLVSTVSENYTTDRGYVLNVSGSSNLKWLNMSRVNQSPSLNQPNGVLEDPLTPYELNVDPGTGLIISKPSLLDANQELIAKKQLFYVTGPKIGQPVLSEVDLEQDYFPFGDQTLPVGNHAPGLIYRWKQGIISVTRDINLRNALDGTGVASHRLAQEVGISVVPQPFSNMDAADIVSLLVTGFPHNYESFLINAQSVGTYNYGSPSNNPESYFHYFFDSTRNTNRALGNFQPFKTYNISQTQLAQRLSLQTNLQSQSKQLAQLRSQLAQLQDQLNSINTAPEQTKQISSNDSALRKTAVAGISASISAVKAQIASAIAIFTNTTQQASSVGLRVYGNDIALGFEINTTSSDQDAVQQNDIRIRTKNEFLQLRTQLKTKFNNDTNLFIVDDAYDKDLDIQAFIIDSLASHETPIWNFTQFQDPFNICVNVAKTLDFEFFADTQGHLQFRCPKYNKTPLSLLLRMFLLNKNQNQKLYPPFLDQLFKDRLQSYKDQANILELNIQINNLLLGKTNIESSPAANSTIQDENNSVVISNFIGADPKSLPADQITDAAIALITLRNQLANAIGGTPNIKDPADSVAVQEAETEIANLNNPATANVNSQRLAIVNKVADLEAEKQAVTTIISRLTAQSSKYDQSIDGAPQKNQPLSPFQMTEILTPFADLIEDDFNDFLGPGSSKRFTIYDEQIISSTFTESDQNVFCRIDVTGQQDLIGEGPGLLAGVPQYWAGATDFDLWRQYGWRSEGSINKPFFKNAATQCAPYALMLLSRAKRDAVRGTITIYGNEYYQLGDVVYVNCRDLLYYVTEVKHNFDYSSGSYTTTLELRYGHALGEYLPTPLDVIGKNLIQNQKNFNTKTILRQTASKALGTSLGVILFNPVQQPNEQTGNTTATPTIDDAFSEMLLGDIGNTNLTTLKNMFVIIKDKLVSGQEFPKLDIRGFVASDADDKNRVLNRIAAVQKWFNTPSEAPDVLLPNNDYPGIDPSLILATSEDVDPINLKDIQQQNAFFGRTPREDVYNVLGDRNFTDVIEVVLIYQ